MVERLSRKDLSTIYERLNKASQGKWEVDISPDTCDKCGGYSFEVVQSEEFLTPVICETNNINDALFIAYAREDIQKLLSEIIALKKERYEFLTISMWGASKLGEREDAEFMYDDIERALGRSVKRQWKGEII